MERYIKVFWYNPPEGNFGDEVGPYLVKKISGRIPICCRPRFKGAIHDLIDSIFIRRSFRESIHRFFFLFMNDPIYLVVGSILGLSNKRTITWGSGFMNSKGVIYSGSFYAVRGMESARRLLELKLPAPDVCGDPALLLPLYYQPNIEKKSVIGIIPHFTEYKYFKEKWGDKYRIICLKTKDVESVVNQIVECSYILSSSLHGIIVSHSYGIPCLWIENKILEKEGFKFKDYFSSVGIDYYRGFDNIEYILESESHILDLFENNQDKIFINVDLSEIQNKLLKVCPFVRKRKSL